MGPPRDCVIVDIDGTLSDPTHRVPLIATPDKTPDWEAFFEAQQFDAPIQRMISVTNALYHAGCGVILCTGRAERWREMTYKWLHKHHVMYDSLLMRHDGDDREDSIVKRELIATEKVWNPQGMNILTIFEDRRRNVEAFRDAGYHVCQVADGNF